MSQRLLAIVTVLAAGDYLLWDWSLAGNHDTMALLSGLTLPLLAIVFVRLLLGILASLIARSARRPRMHAFSRADGTRSRARQGQVEPSPSPTTQINAPPPHSKIAA